MAPGGEGLAKEVESRPCTEAASFLGIAACGGRRACCPFDLGCEVYAGARSVPRGDVPERAGEDRGLALEPRGREGGFWRPTPALGLLLVPGLGSVAQWSAALPTDFLDAAARGSTALPTDFLDASNRGRGLALVDGRGSPTSEAVALDRRAMAGEGAPEVGPEESGDKAECQKGHGYLQANPSAA